MHIHAQAVSVVVGICIFMFKLSWRLSMITVVGLPVIMAVSKLYGEFYGVRYSVSLVIATDDTIAWSVCPSVCVCIMYVVCHTCAPS